MTRRIVAFALRYRALVAVLALALLAGGIAAFRALPVEAYPNPVPPLVELVVQPPGWSAEEVERYVTVPLEIGLAGMPGLDHVRSQSLYGLSDVKCYFRWGVDYVAARQEVINRLQFITLPQGMQAQISPANAIGEIYRFELRGEGYSLQELKTAIDWIVRRQLVQVPGVADVSSFGGETREYHVEVDPIRLRGRGATLAQLTQAIASANQNVGGQRITLGDQAYTVRGIGLVGSVHDLEEAVVLEKAGVPVRVRDVAEVSIGHAPRLGIVGKDDAPDVVQGIVLMRQGAVTKTTLEGVYRRVELIRRNRLLPPGMEMVPYYDRSWLVRVTTRTVMENLLVGMVLVTLVLVLLLGSVRAALVTALNIPLSLLVAFIGMVATGTPANLISLGAVDFGIVVDSTVIVLENLFRHLGGRGHGSIFERVLAASGEVGRPMVLSKLITAVAFLPLFTMTGVSGVIFGPMAATYAFALAGAVLLSLTLTPALATRAIPARTEERETFLMRLLLRGYEPIFRATLRRPRLGAIPPLLFVAAGIALFPLLGSEYMPQLEEGNFWIRATLPVSVSLEESARHVGRMRGILRSHPQVVTVVSQLGRPDDATDVAGFSNIELFAPLRPYGEWPRGLDKAKLTDVLARELSQEFPGVVFNFSQYLADNVEEALSGVKGENSVKIVGPDIARNEATASAVVDVMARVRGVKDLGSFSSMGQPAIRIAPDRTLCARYGLNTGDVEAVVQAAIGGQAVTQVYEGERSFALTVRWLPAFRDSVDAIRRIAVSAPDGSQVPLAQVASIVLEEGPSVIYREDGSRFAPVKFSARGRDLGSTIADASREIAANVKLPPETHLEWSGQINELREAMGRIAWVIPLSVLAIGFLVYGTVKSGLDTVIVLLAIPVACTGGVLALLAAREPFSVSAAMGFVSIFGIAIQDAILVVTYAQRKWEEGLSIVEGAAAAARQRFRAGLMTTLVALLGLLPAALSGGIGAQAQRPLAIVVIGGALALALVNRVMLPPALVLAHGRSAAGGFVPDPEARR